MHETKDDLVKVLTELIALYEAHNEDNWKSWIQNSKSQIMANDITGITHLLSAYGGMGSINDYFFARKAWWSGRLKDEKEDNQRLHKLLSEAYRLAKGIERKYEDDTRR